VRGGGDPYLISEELAELASELVAAIGKEPLTGIALDASYYPSDIRIPGIEDTDEAYDALNSALAVNFNTIHAVRKGKTVRSAESKRSTHCRITAHARQARPARRLRRTAPSESTAEGRCDTLRRKRHRPVFNRVEPCYRT
jgi:D-alanyl-D-alanine carboxypeptidase